MESTTEENVARCHSLSLALSSSAGPVPSPVTPRNQMPKSAELGATDPTFSPPKSASKLSATASPPTSASAACNEDTARSHAEGSCDPLPPSPLASEKPQRQQQRRLLKGDRRPSTTFLDRLLASTRRSRRPQTNMTDFLASFNLGGDALASSGPGPCTSIDDLKLRLRHELDVKVTPERAQHVTVAFEIKGNAQFNLRLSETEDRAIEGLNGIDPSYGGVRSTSVPGESAEGGPQRVVTANETVMAQPQDDPVLQKAVARHIIAAVAETDGSNWTVREVARSAQGWNFTYLCKDSHLQWTRQTAKNPPKVLVGEYSYMEPNSILMSRPAFDCRGSIVISFSRNSRSLNVKYDHTPIHKTVADMKEFFKPPPRQIPAVPGPKTPKTKKGDRAGGSSVRKKKAKDPERMAQDEGTTKRKRKKNNGAAQPVDGNPADQSVDLSPLVAANAATNGDGAPRDAQQPASGLPNLVISDAEAARRRDVATAALSGAGVDPSTLSAEQFNIFSNQSPNLQKESLNMLAKYGAERLRIIHPANRESAPGSATQSSTTTTAAGPSGPITTQELAPASAEPGKKMASRKKKSSGAPGEQVSPVVETPTRKSAKSRLACLQCKGRRVKCPKNTPTCTECETAGLGCGFPPPWPRKRKPEQQVDEEDEEGEQDEPIEGDIHESRNGASDGQQDLHDASKDDDPSSSHQMPVADTLSSGTSQPRAHFHYYETLSGLALPRTQPSHLAQHAQHALSTSPGLGDMSTDASYDGSSVDPRSVLLPRVQSYSSAAPKPPQNANHSPNVSPQGKTTAPAAPMGYRGVSADVSARAGSQNMARDASQKDTNRKQSRQSGQQLSTSPTQMRDNVHRDGPGTNPAIQRPSNSPHGSPFDMANAQLHKPRPVSRTQNRTPVGRQKAANRSDLSFSGMEPSQQSMPPDMRQMQSQPSFGQLPALDPSSNQQSSNQVHYEPYSQELTGPILTAHASHSFGQNATQLQNPQNSSDYSATWSNTSNRAAEPYENNPVYNRSTNNNKPTTGGNANSLSRSRVANPDDLNRGYAQYSSQPGQRPSARVPAPQSDQQNWYGLGAHGQAYSTAQSGSSYSWADSWSSGQ